MAVLSPARWRRRKDARPAEILDAALAVFAERGYAATRMDDIALRAGVTKGTIYLYFDSKDSVFETLVRESIGTALARLLADADRFEGSAADLLRLMLRGIGRFVTTSDRVVLPKIIVAEAGNFPALVQFYRREVIDRGLALLQSVIARGVARGEFRPVTPEHAARICVAPLLLAAVWRTTFAPLDAVPYDYEALVETHIDLLLNGLLPGGAR
jgi:AcrR family transcriptional regulator